jgi:WD40 repeat protein
MGLSTGELFFAISPNGKFIAGAGRHVALRRFPSGALERILDSTHGAMALAFSPDSRTLASGGADQVVRLWDVATGELVRTLPANTNRGVYHLAWDHAGSTLFSGGDDGNILGFEPLTGDRRVVLRGHAQYVYCLALSPDGRMLASAGGDSRILLWNLATAQLTRELRGHNTAVYGLAFSPDGRRLASASWDNTVRIWDVGAEQDARILRGSRSFAYSVAYSPDGRTLASGGHDSAIRIWDPDREATQRILPGASHPVGKVQWWPDANCLLSIEWAGGTRHIYRIWDVRNQGQIRSWTSVETAPVLNGQSILVQGENGPAFFNPATNSEEPVDFPQSNLVDVRYSPDRSRVAVVTAGGEALLFKDPAETPLLRIRLAPFGSRVDTSVQFSPDSRLFITTSPDCQIQIWDARAGRLRIAIPRASALHSALQISPDSRLLLALDSDGYNVWDASTGKKLFSVPRTTTHPAPCFSPDSKTALVGHGDIFELRDSRTGVVRRALKGHYGTALVGTFSPDGRRVATAGDDHTIKLWDAETGRELFSIPGHQTEAHCLAFSADGRHLASCGRDMTIRIWTAATAEEIGEWEARDRECSGLAELHFR